VAKDSPSTTDPDGRLVVFDAGSRQHLALGRPELMDEPISSSAQSLTPTITSRTQSPVASTSTAATSIRDAGCESS
jgi:hypothetical protein